MVLYIKNVLYVNGKRAYRRAISVQKDGKRLVRFAALWHCILSGLCSQQLHAVAVRIPDKPECRIWIG